MKRYIVIESTDKSFMGNFFEIKPEIRTHVELPFTSDIYRCTMHNGINVQLVFDEKIIIGTLR